MSFSVTEVGRLRADISATGGAMDSPTKQAVREAATDIAERYLGAAAQVEARANPTTGRDHAIHFFESFARFSGPDWSEQLSWTFVRLVKASHHSTDALTELRRVIAEWAESDKDIPREVRTAIAADARGEFKPSRKRHPQPKLWARDMQFMALWGYLTQKGVFGGRSLEKNRVAKVIQDACARVGIEDVPSERKIENRCKEMAKSRQYLFSAPYKTD